MAALRGSYDYASRSTYPKTLYDGLAGGRCIALEGDKGTIELIESCTDALQSGSTFPISIHDGTTPEVIASTSCYTLPDAGQPAMFANLSMSLEV